MKHVRCSKCRGFESCRKETKAWIFIIIGFTATLSIRLVTVLMHFSTFLGKLSWYIGVIGFLIFFYYKYIVFRNRSRLIDETNLIEKLINSEVLTEMDYEVLSELLCQIRSNKERINFLFIFLVSGLALIAAIYFDFIVR